MKIVECIPNFSEGRDMTVIAALKKAAQSVAGASLLDIHVDVDHNRSVFTLTGAPEAIEEVAFILASEAVRLIDLNLHCGVHPKMGAVDVIPFVPIRGVDMEFCVELAKRAGERVSRELELPVFLYEYAACKEERSNLADIRRGGFNAMTEKLKLEEWVPDYGKCIPHPTAGVTAIGARKPLIAFNINLDTHDIEIAKAIAKKVRSSSGGLPYCKALGMKLTERGIVQVSMNLTDYEKTPIYQVFEAVQTEVERYGVSILESELVGLAPAKALTESAAYFLKLGNFNDSKHVLEHREELL